MITPMVKAAFMGPRRHVMALLDVLHSVGVVHLEPFAPSDRRLAMDVPSPTGLPSEESRREIAGTVELVRQLLNVLPRPHRKTRAPYWLFNNRIARGDLDRTLESAREEIQPVADRYDDLRQELNLLKRYERVVTALFPLLSEAREEEGLELMGVIVERKRQGVLPLLEKALNRITGGSSRLYTGDMDRANLAAILAYPGQYDSAVRRMLGDENITEIRLPTVFQDKPLAHTLRTLIRRQRELPPQIEDLAGKLADLSGRWYGILSRIEEILGEREQEYRSLGMSSQSRHTFYLKGWLPERDAHRLQELIKSAFGDDVLVELTPAAYADRDQVPVHLANPALIRVFEPLVRLLDLPKYGSLDPTPFVAFFFPLFFGLILGDLGYGFVTLCCAAWLFKRFEERELIRSIAAVFLLSSVSAMVFGLLFGEFFGDLGEHLGMHPLWFDRSRVIIPLLVTALALGFSHILLGYILSLAMSLKAGHAKHIVAAGANITALAALALLGFSVAGYLPRAHHIAFFLILLVLPMLVFSEGIMGPLELLKTFGNVLSYARLMAIGVASVVLAKVANMVGQASESLAVGVVAALLFHAMNLAMGIFSPTIHSLRLHYVEFFGKFFQPGGKPYQPFRRHRSL